ncbi:MAG TPA: NADH-ubiquinone oxidoreductase-F iron-sulfur binding region domain-containing protein [Verrucomicrobiae bacterium]|jgi:NADH-quinone oxidoreductase subunit F|nr:NADH-ubiquinone oxidoreductase-F iron-sulfur binding region domain-containing protein [Verrucomicrobiae bacterium]
MEGILFPRGVAEGREGLDAYRARGGYQALDKALKQLFPREVLQEIDASGLRGRGGAGFPTGKKWAFTADTPETPRYIILNGGEDEPGSKKDRVLMESVPHLILEGIILAAYAVGASKAYLYINAAYKDAIESMEQALAEAKKLGYVGERISGKDFGLEVLFAPAPHEYVAGEDTAVIEVIEGKKPLPRQKPPFPATAGLYGKPTAVNNVETLANVAPIILRGSEWYRGIGTAESPGTMVFSLDDQVNRPGVYELPFGTPLRYLIEDCGGGTRDGKKIKAVLPGGPSSAFLTGDQLDVALDHNSVRAAGSSIGCGVIGIFTEGRCIVEETLKIAEFFAAESCGQCPACRMETNTLAMLLKKIQQGQGSAPMLEQFGKVIAFNKGKGFCSLINMPGPPIESAVKLFRSDFEAHLAGKCPGN